MNGNVIPDFKLESLHKMYIKDAVVRLQSKSGASIRRKGDVEIERRFWTRTEWYDEGTPHRTQCSPEYFSGKLAFNCSRVNMAMEFCRKDAINRLTVTTQGLEKNFRVKGQIKVTRATPDILRTKVIYFDFVIDDKKGIAYSIANVKKIRGIEKGNR